MSLWVKVSTIKLPSGFWERWQAGLSQRHPSKMGDGLLVAYLTHSLSGSSREAISRNKNCGDWRNRKNISYVLGKYKLLNIIMVVEQKCFSGSRLESASKWEERLLYSGGKIVAGSFLCLKFLYYQCYLFKSVSKN